MRDDRDSSQSMSDAFSGWEPGSGSSFEGIRAHSTVLPGPGKSSGARPAGSFEIRPEGGSSLVDGQDLGIWIEFDPGSSRRSVGGPGENPGRTSREPSTIKGRPPFPRRGEEIGGFRLVSELGRGAFARVYLAEEAALAGRKVALKVSAPRGEEPQILARLQHTHIVPIHSVHDDKATGLRLICMPYLGGANLAEVLDASGARLPTQATGRSLLDALDLVVGRQPGMSTRTATRTGPQDSRGTGPDSLLSQTRDGLPLGSRRRSALGRWLDRLHDFRGRPSSAPVPAEDEKAQPARRYFRRSTYIQSAVWIVARLAEGLEHAHNRGLLHRDLKPSNVLIAGDGTPMLLDFNLSADRTDVAEAEVGGTLPYMAPEQLDAFDPESPTDGSVVDVRSDIYSLGLILFETVAGQQPFPDPPSSWPLRETILAMIAARRAGAPSVRERNPTVPWSLDSILRKCLDPEPDRRYQHAGALAEDLRRFLDDLPLATAPEPSYGERIRKWARRNPRATSATSVGTVAALLLVTCLGLASALAWGLGEARSRLRWQEFRDLFRESEFYLNTASGPDDRDHRERGIAEAKLALNLFGPAPDPHWGEGPEVRRLPPDKARVLRERMVELAILLADAEKRQSLNPRGKAADVDLKATLDRLNWAEQIGGELPRAFYLTRAELLDILDQPAAAAADRRAAEERWPPKRARDLQWEGVRLLAAGRPEEAEIWLERAAGQDSQDYWSWFLLGYGQAARGKTTEAVGSFRICTVLAPDFAWSYLNLGIVQARLDQIDQALVSFDRALELKPNFAEALVNRGRILLLQGRPDRAALDLSRAKALGRTEPAVLAGTVEALGLQGQSEEADRELADALGRHPNEPILLVVAGFRRLDDDPAGAADRFERALAIDPRNVRAHLGLAHRHRHNDPDQALTHLDAALEIDPNCYDALELRALMRAKRGDLRGAEDAERLLRAPTSRRLYNAACVYSLLSRYDAALADRALELLRRAVHEGRIDADPAADPDLEPIRDRPGFRAIRDRPGDQGADRSASTRATPGAETGLGRATTPSGRRTL